MQEEILSPVKKFLCTEEEEESSETDGSFELDDGSDYEVGLPEKSK